MARSNAVNTPISASFATTRNKGKTPVPMPSFKHSYVSNNQNIRGISGSFGGDGNKGASSSKEHWNHPKDVKANFKGSSKPSISGKHYVNRERIISNSKGYDSWNKAKAKLTADEYNKRRRTNACINCGEIGH